ncbi:MAG: DUF192 domain-containing protein [Gammaproteobacteria bacterium]
MQFVTRMIVTTALLAAFGASQAQNKCFNTTMGLSAMHQEQIVLVNDAGQHVELSVLVADDNYERASGFQHICPEIVDEVMILFEYPAATFGRFHMQNVFAPLDIAFFDAEGRLIRSLLMETYTEDSKPLYDPGKPFQYALEARKDFFREIGVQTTNSYLLPNN